MRPRGSVGEVFGVLRQIISTHGPCRLDVLRAQAAARGVSPNAVKWTVANAFRLGLMVDARGHDGCLAGKRGRLIDVPERLDTFSVSAAQALDLSSLWSAPAGLQEGMQ